MNPEDRGPMLLAVVIVASASLAIALAVYGLSR